MSGKGIIIALSFFFLATSVSSQFCAGCFGNVSKDWHNDTTLRAVVNKAFEGTKEFVARTFAHEVGNSAITLKNVSNIKQQVVAGMNYRMNLEVKLEGGRKSFVCSGFTVFKPLPFNCDEGNGSELCLEFNEDEIKCSIKNS